MKVLLIICVAICLFIPSIAMPQVNCFAYGSGPGSMLSCDGPSGNTTIVPFSSTGGIITQDGNGRSSLEPYTLFPPASSNDFSSRPSESFSSRPIEPLNRLDRLDRLDRTDRMREDSMLLPLLLGE